MEREGRRGEERGKGGEGRDEEEERGSGEGGEGRGEGVERGVGDEGEGKVEFPTSLVYVYCMVLCKCIA